MEHRTGEGSKLTDSHAPGARGRADGRRRVRAGWVLTGLGIACIAWGALHLADASMAGSGRSFETRPTYDQTKRQAQAALLGAVLRGLGGLALIGIGARLRAGSGSDGPSAPL